MSFKLHFVPNPLTLKKNEVIESSNSSIFSYCGHYQSFTPLWDGFGLSHCFFDTATSGLFLILIIAVVHQILQVKR